MLLVVLIVLIVCIIRVLKSPANGAAAESSVELQKSEEQAATKDDDGVYGDEDEGAVSSRSCLMPALEMEIPLFEKKYKAKLLSGVEAAAVLRVPERMARVKQGLVEISQRAVKHPQSVSAKILGILLDYSERGE